MDDLARLSFKKETLLLHVSLLILITKSHLAVADPEGVQGVHLNPLLSLNYSSFLGNFKKI